MVKEDTTRCYYECKAHEYFLATYKLDLQPLWCKLDSRLSADSLLLDLGCGSGRDMRHFSSKGHRVFGLDYSLELLKLAKAYTDLPVVCANFSNIPFMDDTFDAVWALGSLLHVRPHTLPKVLSEIRRVLKADAQLFTAMKKGSGEETDARARYNVYYSAMAWKGVLEKNKFEELETEIITERREHSLGEQVEIDWIVSVSRLA